MERPPPAMGSDLFQVYSDNKLEKSFPPRLAQIHDGVFAFL